MSKKRLPTEASPPPLDSAMVFAPSDDPDLFYQALVDHKLLRVIAGFEFNAKRHGFTVRLPFRGAISDNYEELSKSLLSAGFQVFRYNSRKDALLDSGVPQLIFRGIPTKCLEKIFEIWPEGSSFVALEDSNKDLVSNLLVSDGVPAKMWKFGYKSESKFCSLILHYADWDALKKALSSGLIVKGYGFKHGLPHISHFDVFPNKDETKNCCLGKHFISPNARC